jgi:hypothetical protein
VVSWLRGAISDETRVGCYDMQDESLPKLTGASSALGAESRPWHEEERSFSAAEILVVLRSPSVVISANSMFFAHIVSGDLIVSRLFYDLRYLNQTRL